MIPKNLLIDFDSLKVGDKLFDSQKGEVIVFKLSEKGYGDYPLICKSRRAEFCYTRDGKIYYDYPLPSLFLSNPFDLISEYPKEMWVSNYEKYSKKVKIVYCNENDTQFRYLAEDGEWYCNAKDIEPEPPILEISMEEAMEKLTKIYKQNIRIK